MIPKLHYISQGKSPKEHLENIQQACQSGIELVLLSFKNISNKDQLSTAKEAREITAHFQTRLIINSHYKIAKEVKADGVHLEKKDVCPTFAKEELYSWQIIGGVAHTLEDCKSMIEKKVAYIHLGPFKTIDTTKKSSLGANGYLTILEELQTKTPIIATGGIETDDLLDIMITKVHGVAISKAITRNFNNIPKINTFLNAPSSMEQVYKFDDKKEN